MNKVKTYPKLLSAIVFLVHVGFEHAVVQSSDGSKLICCFIEPKHEDTGSPRRLDSKKVVKLRNNQETPLLPRIPSRPLRPTAILKPCHYIRSPDPAHPDMRTYIERDKAMSANLLPENSYFKDHDSQVLDVLYGIVLMKNERRLLQADGGHPNHLVIKRMKMNDTEISDHIWDLLKE
jgi:hypothetical protein